MGLHKHCFWTEPTGIARVYLRRYRIRGTGDDNPDACSTCEHGYHQARVLVGDFPDPKNEAGAVALADAEFQDDPRWPIVYPCGVKVPDDVYSQVFRDPIYKRADTGELIPFRAFPVGAMYDASWYRSNGLEGHRGADGLSIVVLCPGNPEPVPWFIDGAASNCTIPDDWSQVRHHCWVRDGVPPNITVGKGGPTCSAGAGSISVPGWHGWLTNGVLDEERTPSPCGTCRV